MIDRASYRLATDALRRLRDGHAGLGPTSDGHHRQSLAGSARAEEVEAHALDYLYGRRSTGVELLGAVERPTPGSPRRKRARTRT
jgi:hypothetical protein